MSANMETRRVKEALELQVSAIRAHAERLSSQDVDTLESELMEVERAVADLRGMVASLPHRFAAADPSQRQNE